MTWEVIRARPVGAAVRLKIVRGSNGNWTVVGPGAITGRQGAVQSLSFGDGPAAKREAESHLRSLRDNKRRQRDKEEAEKKARKRAKDNKRGKRR